MIDELRVFKKNNNLTNKSLAAILCVSPSTLEHWFTNINKKTHGKINARQREYIYFKMREYVKNQFIASNQESTRLYGT